MKIGIYGGTFNPIHYGHLININLVKDEFNLDKILLIPSCIPVHKNISKNISTVDRLEMTKLAVQDKAGLEVSTIEIDREEPSYTIDTIAELNEIYPYDGIILIMGADSFNELHTWKEYQKLLNEVSIIVMLRPGDYNYSEEILEKTKKVEFAHNPEIEISSTFIRERIKKDQSVDFLLPDKVINYINKKGLYSN